MIIIMGTWSVLPVIALSAYKFFKNTYVDKTFYP